MPDWVSRCSRRSWGRLPMLAGNIFVVILLVLVCANVASLAIARRSARERETAIRLALGAGRARIVREHLAETAVCATLSRFLQVTVSPTRISIVRGEKAKSRIATPRVAAMMTLGERGVGMKRSRVGEVLLAEGLKRRPGRDPVRGAGGPAVRT